MPFLIENLTMLPIKVGGWYDDYNRQAAKQIRTLLPGHKLEVDEGALNNRVIRDLQSRGVIRISEVDLIPIKSQDNAWEDLEVGDSGLSLDERITILEAGGGSGDYAGRFESATITSGDIPDTKWGWWWKTTTSQMFLVRNRSNVLYFVETNS
jgi:hypothetical protein